MSSSLTSTRPPQALIDAMGDDREVRRFEIWKSTAGNDLHPAFGERAQYDSQRAVWKGIATDELENVLTATQKLNPTLDIIGCTWEDLLQQIDAAVETDEAKSRKSKLRNGFRSSKSDIQFLNSLLSVIPDEKGMSLLRGGLSVIFQMWIQRIETREQVLELLADVVRTFALAQEQRRFFPNDQELSQLVRDLYGVMLDAIQGLVSILLRIHKGSWLQRVRKQLPTHEAERLSEITTTINVHKTKLSERLHVLSIEQGANMHKNSETIKREVQTTRFRLSNMETDVSLMSDHVWRTQSYVEKVYDQGQDHSTQLKENNEMLEAMRKQFLEWGKAFDSGLSNIKELQTLMYQIMGEDILTEKLGWRSKFRIQDPTRQLEHHSTEVSFAQLISTLNVDPTPMLQETQDIMRKANSMEPEGLAQVRYLRSTTHFQNWISSLLPSTLLVDGYCGESGIGRTSPLSVFCASLGATIARTDRSIPLLFFCGKHRNPKYDSLAGPSGLLRSIITQLILYPKATSNSSIPMEQNLWEGIARYDIGALLALFERVLMHVDPYKTVYCIIDSISDYQSGLHKWADSLLYVLQHLHRLADRNQQHPQLKLFMTSANRTRDVSLIASQINGEYVTLRTGRSDDRPIHGRAFDRDIDAIIQARQSGNAFHSP
ncbi:hypothetical protein DM02DRAFT_618276 [Periconia macrospinosa]|uniref:Nephrocystin 3-like N-terminal domain-containing protein n=1 Tax=Periconia macrospinosa TaxID=97972 RepID=A0A2V1D9Z3_9PLEO|nr:hypothetical protein DM02DRAFT_618276 [Periconia macrospinosa]